MRTFTRFFLLVAIGAFIATIAFGQAGEVSLSDETSIEVATDWADTATALLTIWLPRICILATLLTASFPSTNKFMRVVDAFAGSWGKARNDPNAQKWGQ